MWSRGVWRSGYALQVWRHRGMDAGSFGGVQAWRSPRRCSRVDVDAWRVRNSGTPEARCERLTRSTLALILLCTYPAVPLSCFALPAVALFYFNVPAVAFILFSCALTLLCH